MWWSGGSDTPNYWQRSTFSLAGRLVGICVNTSGTGCVKSSPSRTPPGPFSFSGRQRRRSGAMSFLVFVLMVVAVVAVVAGLLYLIARRWLRWGGFSRRSPHTCPDRLDGVLQHRPRSRDSPHQRLLLFRTAYRVEQALG